MITVEQALELIVQKTGPLPPASIEIDKAFDLVITEDIFSDNDIPPFDRSRMDGYAVRSADVSKGATLKVTGVIRAGTLPEGEVLPGECRKIMTGAPMPGGADAVVKVEDTEGGADDVTIQTTSTPGKFVEPAGSILSKGDVVRTRGHRVGIFDIPLLASCNIARVPAYPKPTVAVLSSGDEIVELGAPRSEAQIPNVNRHSLSTLLKRDGITAHYLGIAPDEETAARELVRKGLTFDVLITSGGVSMGDWDLLGDALTGEGVEPLFTRVSSKPGKPTFFGVHEKGIVFGLPGNPVSVVVTYLLYVRTALGRLMGLDVAGPEYNRMQVIGGEATAKERRFYAPGRIVRKGSVGFVELLQYKGSADLKGIADADAFVAVEPGATVGEGDEVKVLVL